MPKQTSLNHAGLIELETLSRQIQYVMYQLLASCGKAGDKKMILKNPQTQISLIMIAICIYLYM